MKEENREIRSLNETFLADISIEELEARLQVEELDVRGEMWTGCGCVELCVNKYDPNAPCSIYTKPWDNCYPVLGPGGDCPIDVCFNDALW